MFELFISIYSGLSERKYKRVSTENGRDMEKRRGIDMRRLFGTDGIRGIANEFLSGELAYYTGRATATVLREVGKKYILIGKDTRQSGDMLEAALTAGITSVGVNVVRLGVIPTPGVAYLTTQIGRASCRERV